MFKPIILALCLALASCGALNVPTPESPSETVYAARAAYGATFYSPFAQYASLPDCDDTTETACSEDSVMHVLNDVNESAKATLDAAEAVVRADPNGDGSISWAKAAEETVAAAVKILKQYGIGG